MNLILFNRAIANAGPMSDQQRKAMWAKRSSPGTSARRPPMDQGEMRTASPAWTWVRPVLPTPPEGIDRRMRLPGVPSGSGARYADEVAGGSRPTTPRGWGESRPGEMYVQWEGPGNPSWERRHPHLDPANRPARDLMPPIKRPKPVPVKPIDRIRSPPADTGIYLGGSSDFDERTGRRIRFPPEDNPVVRKLLDRLRGFTE